MLQIHCFQLFFLSSKSFQIPSQCVLQMHIVSIYFSAVPNCFRYHQNACFRDISFNRKTLQFQIVSNTARMHALDTLFSIISLQFQIVPNTFRAHALKTLFSKEFSEVSNRFKYLQSACLKKIPPECMLKRHCFQDVLCSSKSF